MKRITLLALFSLLCVFRMAGQGLRVADFYLMENDLTATTPGTERYDRNGDKCAVLKVTVPERDFTFDCGLMGYTHLEQHPGEVWLWVSPRLQHITVSHNLFGKAGYDIRIPVEGGRSYAMLIDIGTGRYVNITTTVARSSVVIDGEYVGLSPVYNHYLSYGRHTIVARNDKHEGRLEKVLTDADKPGLVLNVDMQDLSHLYADVVVTTAPLADIFYNSQKVATGTWRTQLREGTHTVETRQIDAEPQNTTFTVVAGKPFSVEAIAPVPHTGYLSIYTRPRNVQATIDGNQNANLTQTLTLPVGTHQVQMAHKGYVPVQREYTIKRGQTECDTVQLERIKYVKPVAFYFGAAYTLRSLGGVTGIVGAVIKGHDIQASYTFGLTESNPVHWYGDGAGSPYLSSITYKMRSLAVKYGYQIDLMRQLAITPQVGYSCDQLGGTLTRGTRMYADGCYAHCATIGLKLLLVPMQHVYLFAAPEYAIALKKDANYDRLIQTSDITAGGFTAHLGILVNF